MIPPIFHILYWCQVPHHHCLVLNPVIIGLTKSSPLQLGTGNCHDKVIYVKGTIIEAIMMSALYTYRSQTFELSSQLCNHILNFTFSLHGVILHFERAQFASPTSIIICIRKLINPVNLTSILHLNRRPKWKQYL